MTCRSYPIRVGNTDKGTSGGWYPDQQETTWEALGVEPELTTVTKRVRRVATWSWQQFTDAVRANEPDAIWLGFIGDGIAPLEQAADIAPNATGAVNLHVASSQRGWLRAPRVRLQTRFPLGLLRAWSYWLPDAKALVYPYPEEYAPPLPMLGLESQDGQGQAGHEDFAGVRAYQAGDSMKRLAWRQIARIDVQDGGALVTKHFEGGAKSELSLDFAQLPRTMDLEMRLSRMTRWVLEAEQQGLPYSFRLGDTEFAAALGPAHQSACLRALALYEGH